MASLSPSPPPRRGSSSSTQGSSSSGRSPAPGGIAPAINRVSARTLAPTRSKAISTSVRTSGWGLASRPSAAGDPLLASPCFASAPAPSPHQEPPGVIPNAIVIKNIPFSLSQEALTALMVDLDLPMPYAFNYHYDQGQFRGLAFANFPVAEDADQAVVALNGFDVIGRKLRVEHKRVLQQGEKGRIEKEKAVKRMQSLQRERHRRLQSGVSFQDASVPTTPSSTSIASPGPLTPVNGAGFLLPLPGWERRSGSSAKAGGDELNLNDPFALDIYSRVLLFKDDRLRDELAFSKSLTPSERRMVHLVAQRLGLYHYSTGQGEDRCAIVSKVDPVGLVRTSLSCGSCDKCLTSACVDCL